MDPAARDVQAGAQRVAFQGDQRHGIGSSFACGLATVRGARRAVGLSPVPQVSTRRPDRNRVRSTVGRPDSEGSDVATTSTYANPGPLARWR
jgi:hypothetical protein